ncbi:hypothetical protein ACE1CI_03195 [Aerosakkonemataceae cyanobacterium BLCC-F50]|uniref:Uncharacterized protein n=1 Tax=Floridaenema flaviceps BLCC-F50 TaxID=3153642 RepID=A0ABV4XLF2_9CYAN
MLHSFINGCLVLPLPRLLWLYVFAILLLAWARDLFHAKVKALFPGWIDAIAID